MKKSMSILLGFILIAVSIHPTAGMVLNNTAQITTSEDCLLYGSPDSFALSGQKTVWLDYRDPSGTPQLFGVRLDDPTFAEFSIDTNVLGASLIAFSDPFVLYTFTEGYPSPLLLKIADIQNPNAPVLTEILPLINDIYDFDIADNLIVYYGPDSQNEYRYTVLAVDFSQPNNPQHFLIDIAPSDAYISTIALDGPFAVWNEAHGEGPSLVKIADLTNPAQPQIVSVQLPDGITFDKIEVSENNLAARGNQNWRSFLCAVKNYRNTEEWNILTFWKEAGSDEYLVSGPKIDGPIILWVVTTRAPAAADAGTLQNEPISQLKAAYLLSSTVSVSTLLTTSAPDQIMAADISGRQIVWSMGPWEQIELYKGSLALECGDWGYKPGDINKDCLVNLDDLACLAQNWLSCTTPDQPDCEYGS